MSDYQSHLLEQSKTWPVVCAQGVYDYNGLYHNTAEALLNSNMLRDYQDLTINHTVDLENTLRSFFTVGDPVTTKSNTVEKGAASDTSNTEE